MTIQSNEPENLFRSHFQLIPLFPAAEQRGPRAIKWSDIKSVVINSMVSMFLCCCFFFLYSQVHGFHARSAHTQNTNDDFRMVVSNIARFPRCRRSDLKRSGENRNRKKKIWSCSWKKCLSHQHGSLRDLGTFSVKPHSPLWLSSTWGKNT